MPKRPPVLGLSGARAAEAERRWSDRARGSAASRGYDRDWQRLRALVLNEEPLCRFCLEKGRPVPAEAVDHIQTVRAHPELRLVRSNLRSLCVRCHNAHTARRGRGGDRGRGV